MDLPAQHSADEADDSDNLVAHSLAIALQNTLSHLTHEVHIIVQQATLAIPRSDCAVRVEVKSTDPVVRGRRGGRHRARVGRLQRKSLCFLSSFGRGYVTAGGHMVRAVVAFTSTRSLTACATVSALQAGTVRATSTRGQWMVMQFVGAKPP